MAGGQPTTGPSGRTPGASTFKTTPVQSSSMFPLETTFPGALSGTVALVLGLLMTAVWLYYLYR
jgi:hypothetical protein